MNKDELYKRIKIAAMISFIPIVLVAGPLSGFFLGEFLQKKFNLSTYSLFISITIGFIVSIRETVRILRLVAKMESRSR